MEVKVKEKETSNRDRSDIAIFSGKCFMLHLLLDDIKGSRLPSDLKEHVLASMFRQSEAVLGIQ